MRFRLKSLLISVAVVAVVLAVVVLLREQRQIARDAAWNGLQSNGVLLLASSSEPNNIQNAEIWVSTIDSQTFEVNGERLSRNEARTKLVAVGEHLKRLGIRWYVLLDREPGTNDARQSTFDLVYSAGFTTYDNLASQGASTYEQRRTEGEARNRLYVRTPDGKLLPVAQD